MPQIFKIGSYWVYFWTNEMNHLNLSMYLKEVPRQMPRKSGLPRLENAVWHIIIPEFLTAF